MPFRVKERILIAVLCVAMTLPFWFAEYPYLIDYPSHLARWHIMLSDSPLLSANYSFEWRLVGNLGTDLLAFALGRLVDIETTGRIITGAIPAIVALGVLLVSRALGRPFAVGAILALLLVYNKAFLLGFLNYSLGVGLALIAFACWIRGARPLVFIPIAFGLWLCHIAAWGAFCVMVFGFELSQCRDPKRMLRRLWPVALPAALLLLGGAGLANPPHELADKLRMWIGAVGFRNFVLSVAVMAAIYSALLIAWREKLPFDSRVGIPALLLGLCTVLMPPGLGGGDLADLRLVPLVLILALLSIGVVGPWSLRLAASVFLMIQIGLITVDWRKQSMETDRALSALAFIKPGETVRVAVIESEDALEQSPYMHIAGYATVRKDAFTNTDFTIPGVHLLRTRNFDFRDPSQVVLLPSGSRTATLDSGKVKLWVLHYKHTATGRGALHLSQSSSLFSNSGTILIKAS